MGRDQVFTFCNKKIGAALGATERTNERQLEGVSNAPTVTAAICTHEVDIKKKSALGI